MPSPAAAPLALALAQARGPGVRPHLGRIATFGLDADQAKEFFLRATRRGRDDAPEMTRAALRTDDPALIEGLFAAGRSGGFPIVLDAALVRALVPGPPRQCGRVLARRPGQGRGYTRGGEPEDGGGENRTGPHYDFRGRGRRFRL